MSAYRTRSELAGQMREPGLLLLIAALGLADLVIVGCFALGSLIGP